MSRGVFLDNPEHLALALQGIACCERQLLLILARLGYDADAWPGASAVEVLIVVRLQHKFGHSAGHRNSHQADWRRGTRCCFRNLQVEHPGPIGGETRKVYAVFS